jgi:hypothetical protein
MTSGCSTVTGRPAKSAITTEAISGIPLEHGSDLVLHRVGLAVVAVAVDVHRTFGRIWPKRSTMPSGPKSGEQEDHTAPSDVAASMSTTVSMQFGMIAATRSPRPTPSRAAPPAHGRRDGADHRRSRARRRGPRRRRSGRASSPRRAQEVLREAQLRAREPRRAGHRQRVASPHDPRSGWRRR